MEPVATRAHPSLVQIGHPLNAKPCKCSDEPAADPNEMTCWRCGHQIGGVPLPARVTAFRIDPSPLPAAKRRHYRPAQ